MVEEIKAYKPKCCNKAMMTRGSTLRHERNCLKNPENRACRTCKHLKLGCDTVYNPHHGGPPRNTDFDVFEYYCEVDAAAAARGITKGARR